jgi:hypothetical protein
MRIVMSLAGLGLLAAAAIAQPPAPTDFATDASRRPIEPITVTVLPAAAVIPVPVAPPLAPMGYSAEQLLRMKECELVQVYKSGIPGMPPCGYAPGIMIFQPGSPFTVPFARIIGATFWQGKMFPGDGTMVNRMFGLPAIKAAIGPGESFIDGRPSVIFDYQDTSFVWRNYRDEVREVSPGVYLGIMHRVAGWHEPMIATWFALDLVHGQSGCKGK